MTKYTKKAANKSTKSKAISPSNDLPIIQQNACGIDVGAESIFVCVPRDRDSTPILQGERDPAKLALHRHGRCKSSEETIAKALEGNWREEHLLSLKHAWEAYQFFHKQVLECELNLEHSDSYLGAYYRKMRGKFGAPKANRATSHKLAKIIYAMLRDGKEFTELGQTRFEELHKEKTLINMQSRANKLGYKLVPIETAA